MRTRRHRGGPLLRRRSARHHDQGCKDEPSQIPFGATILHFPGERISTLSRSPGPTGRFETRRNSRSPAYVALLEEGHSKLAGRNRFGRRPMARLFKILVLFLIVAGGVTGAYFWLQSRKDAEAPFKLVEVERGSITEKAIAVGQIEPRLKFEVKSKISGIVKRCAVEVGDRVDPGDPLFEIVPDPTPSELVEAQHRDGGRGCPKGGLRAGQDRARHRARQPGVDSRRSNRRAWQADGIDHSGARCRYRPGARGRPRRSRGSADHLPGRDRDGHHSGHE